MKWTLCIASAALLLGCRAAAPPSIAQELVLHPDSVESVARLRAAAEFRCPATDVMIESVSDPTVRVFACGQVATYTCPAFYRSNQFFNRACIREPDFPAGHR
jgi:hypothetical protein